MNHRTHKMWTRVLGLWVASGMLWGLILSFARADDVIPTNTWVDFYSLNSTFQGQPLPVGASIAIFDPQGVQCGAFTVKFTGMYGVMPCYGDDPLTIPDEGAVLGDVLHFTINGQAAQTEVISVNGAPLPPNTVVVWSPAQSLWRVNLHAAADESTATPTPTATVSPTASATPTRRQPRLRRPPHHHAHADSIPDSNTDIVHDAHPDADPDSDGHRYRHVLADSIPDSDTDIVHDAHPDADPDPDGHPLRHTHCDVITDSDGSTDILRNAHLDTDRDPNGLPHGHPHFGRDADRYANSDHSPLHPRQHLR